MKETNYDEWIQPNKWIPITYFFKESKNKVEFEDNNNKHNMLIDNDENDDEYVDEIKVHKSKLNRTKGKSENNDKKQRDNIKSKRLSHEMWSCICLLADLLAPSGHRDPFGIDLGTKI